MSVPWTQLFLLIVISVQSLKKAFVERDEKGVAAVQFSRTKKHGFGYLKTMTAPAATTFVSFGFSVSSLVNWGWRLIFCEHLVRLCMSVCGTVLVTQHRVHMMFLGVQFLLLLPLSPFPLPSSFHQFLAFPLSPSQSSTVSRVAHAASAVGTLFPKGAL